MATRYIEIVGTSGHSLPTPPDRTNANAAAIYVDGADSFALKFNKNGVVTYVSDSGSAIASQRQVKYATLALTGAAVHAAAVGIVNPEAVDVLVVNATLALTTHATAANGSIDVGWTASSITTASATMQDGILVGSGVTVPVTYPCTTPQVYWTAGTWITVSDDGTADVTGMVAKLYIAYILK